MEHVVEQTNTPARVAHSATAALNMDGAGLRKITAEQAATPPLELALAALLQP